MKLDDYKWHKRKYFIKIKGVPLKRHLIIKFTLQRF